MKKYAPTKSKKVIKHIPDDLVFSILSKSPFKSLKRFGAVRKSWFLLFENSHFMRMIRNNFLSNNHCYYDDTSLLLHSNMLENIDELNPYYEFKTALYMLSGERFENRVNIEWPNPFQDNYQGFRILGSSSINGIFCIYRYKIEKKLVALWNPSTKEFKVIPSLPIELEYCVDYLHGYGYDHLKNDYKVIRQIFSRNNYNLDGIPDESWWEIYSLRSNSWSKLNIDMPSCRGDFPGVRLYMDGVCHWVGISEIEFCDVCLVSFNMSAEEFVITPIASAIDNMFNVRSVWTYLVVLNGYVALISHFLLMPTFDISILSEFGVKDSWIKLFSIEHLSCIEYPIGVGNKGNIFFKKKDGEVVWYDLSTAKIVDLGFKVRRNLGNIVIYKESLCPIGGTNS